MLILAGDRFAASNQARDLADRASLTVPGCATPGQLDDERPRVPPS